MLEESELSITSAENQLNFIISNRDVHRLTKKMHCSIIIMIIEGANLAFKGRTTNSGT